MTLGDLHLMRPEWLWALLPAALLALLLWRMQQRSGSWQAVIDPDLLRHLVSEESSHGRRRAWLGILIAWVIAVIALCGPSMQKLPQPVHQRQDALVIILDLSLSMNAQDLAPSRLDRARQKILDLLRARVEGQTGLIAYAGDAHVVTPLTDDNPTIANLLPALNPGMMPIPGSDPVAAMRLAVDLLRSGGSSGGRIVLITDAVAAAQRDALASVVKDAGVALTVMGVGTASGAPIPLPDGGFLKDASGTIVIPRLDGAALAGMARDTGGRYLPLRPDNANLVELANPQMLPNGGELEEREGRSADQWEDQGYLLVLLLLPLGAALFRRGWLLALVPLLLLGQPRPASAQAWEDLWLTPDQQGHRALAAGDSERAQQLFQDPAWSGTAAYQSGDYTAAASAFEALDSADAWYNRGNALARAGELDAAIAAYRESLARKPEQADAQNNIELLEALKQQQEQQQQEQQQNQENQQDPQNQQDAQDPADSQSARDQQNQQDGEPQGGDNARGEDEPAEEPQADQAEPQGQPGEQEQAEPQPQAGDEEPAEQEMRAGEMEAREGEQDQAMEQWLRRVPDDPSGLLREKFRYESRQRQREQQDTERNNDTYW